MKKYYLCNDDNNIMDESGQVIEGKQITHIRGNYYNVEGKAIKPKVFDTKDAAEGVVWAMKLALGRKWHIGTVEHWKEEDTPQ